MTIVCEGGLGEARVARKRGRAPSQRAHGCAKTTPRVRRAIQASDQKNTVLAKQYRIHRQTVAKWKARDTPFDARMGPKHPRSSVLTLEDEAIILAYRWRTRLSLNESLMRLRCLMPQLTRSALYRCLKRHGHSNIGSTAKCPPLTSAALRGPYCFEMTSIKIGAPNDVFAEVPPVFLAVEDATREVCAQVATTTPKTAAAFLDRLVTQFSRSGPVHSHGRAPSPTVHIDAGLSRPGTELRRFCPSLSMRDRRRAD
jgi:hypothetical protein